MKEAVKLCLVTEISNHLERHINLNQALTNSVICAGIAMIDDKAIYILRSSPKFYTFNKQSLIAEVSLSLPN